MALDLQFQSLPWRCLAAVAIGIATNGGLLRRCEISSEDCPLKSTATTPPPPRNDYQNNPMTISFGKRPGALTRNSCKNPKNNSTQNLPHFRAFPASIQEHSPPKCLFFMANAKLPNRPAFALLPAGGCSIPGGFPTFFGKGPDCVTDPFGTVPRRCC